MEIKVKYYYEGMGWLESSTQTFESPKEAITHADSLMESSKKAYEQLKKFKVAVPYISAFSLDHTP